RNVTGVQTCALPISAWTWVNTPLIGNGKSWINIGVFVGSVQETKEGTDGNLTLQNVKYDADDDAKISALAESGTDRENSARLSPDRKSVVKGKRVGQ